MPAYDAKQFDPPAPVASAVIRSRQSGVTFSNVMMLLDSGADVTLLPQTAVEQLGVLPIPEQRYELVGFDGTTSSAQVAELEMVFLNRIFRERFLLIGDEMGILGRDVLNHVSLLFNGPGQYDFPNLPRHHLRWNLGYPHDFAFLSDRGCLSFSLSSLFQRIFIYNPANTKSAFFLQES